MHIARDLTTFKHGIFKIIVPNILRFKMTIGNFLGKLYFSGATIGLGGFEWGFGLWVAIALGYIYNFFDTCGEAYGGSIGVSVFGAFFWDFGLFYTWFNGVRVYGALGCARGVTLNFTVPCGMGFYRFLSPVIVVSPGLVGGGTGSRFRFHFYQF